jgi:hypothetical protein
MAKAHERSGASPAACRLQICAAFLVQSDARIVYRINTKNGRHQTQYLASGASGRSRVPYVTNVLLRSPNLPADTVSRPACTLPIGLERLGPFARVAAITPTWPPTGLEGGYLLSDGAVAYTRNRDLHPRALFVALSRASCTCQCQDVAGCTSADFGGTT